MHICQICQRRRQEHTYIQINTEIYLEYIGVNKITKADRGLQTGYGRLTAGSKITRLRRSDQVLSSLIVSSL